LGSRPVEDGRDHVDDFNSSLKLPMGEALIKSPPRLRVTRAVVPRMLTSSHGGAPGLRTSHTRDGRRFRQERKSEALRHRQHLLRPGHPLGSPKRSERCCRAPSRRRCASCFCTARKAVDGRLCLRARHADERALSTLA